mmetsp:Transcript_22771/g.21971  ORF Transcript_22771/g.21971 Transcript_22771/m.21971 type:complete len:151 (-) Transcript_22771:258-710(-)
MPGPGNYADAFDVSKSGPKFTFSAKPSRKDESVSPGPAAYDSSAATSLVRPHQIGGRMGSAERGKKGGLLFGGRQDEGNEEIPAFYDAKSSLGGPAFPFGNDEKMKNTRNFSPGPGAYDNKDSIVKSGSAKAKFGTSQRKNGADGKSIQH